MKEARNLPVSAAEPESAEEPRRKDEDPVLPKRTARVTGAGTEGVLARRMDAVALCW